MEGFSPVLHQPWEMERPTGKYPHGPRRLTAGPFPGEPYGHKGAWYLGPRVPPRGRFRGGTWCPGPLGAGGRF